MEPQPSKFSLKEIIVVVPIFGTALALFWEIGTFYPIRGGAFS